VALIENVQRENLNPVDEARAYQRLVEEFGRTHAEISKAVGKNRSTVTNLLRLLALPEEVLVHVSRGTLSAGHARALLKLDDPEDQVRVARQIVEEAWSVRETERRVGADPGSPGSPTDLAGDPDQAQEKHQTPKGPIDPQVARVEEAIRRYLGTEVHLHHTAQGGRIEIRYFSNEELERLLEQIGIEVY
jgi:ParB family chromosome partitioning protein